MAEEKEMEIKKLRGIDEKKTKQICIQIIYLFNDRRLRSNRLASLIHFTFIFVESINYIQLKHGQFQLFHSRGDSTKIWRSIITWYLTIMGRPRRSSSGYTARTKSRLIDEILKLEMNLLMFKFPQMSCMAWEVRGARENWFNFINNIQNLRL